MSSSIDYVSATTTFTFSYFFNTSKPNVFNRMEVGFLNSADIMVPFIEEMKIVDDWASITVSCNDMCCYNAVPECKDSCCSDITPKCQGQVRIFNTNNRLQNRYYNNNNNSNNNNHVNTLITRILRK